MRHRFGLTQDEVDALADQEFLDMAAEAYFLREQEVETVKAGFLEALAEVAKRIRIR